MICSVGATGAASPIPSASGFPTCRSFRWTAAESKRMERILLENVTFPQTFVRAWALDSLATLSERKAKLLPVVLRHLDAFAPSSSKALQARARAIRARLAERL